jgi:hypothetical protein
LCHRLKAWGQCPWPRTARGLSGSLRGCAGSSSQRLTKAGGAEHDGEHGIATTATDRNVWSEGTENATLTRSVPGADLITLKSSWLKDASPRGRFRTLLGHSAFAVGMALPAPQPTFDLRPAECRQRSFALKPQYREDQSRAVSGAQI